MLRLSLGLAFALLLANTTAAASLTLVWHGYVDWGDGRLPEVRNADSLYASYTFDCPNPCSGVPLYPTGITSISVSVGSHVYTADLLGIVAADNTIGPGFRPADIYRVSLSGFHGPAMNGFLPDFLELTLYDPSQAALPGSDLVVHAFNTSSVGFVLPQEFVFYFRSADGGTQVTFGGALWYLTIVPEPAIPVLLWIVLAPLLAARLTLDSVWRTPPEWRHGPLLRPQVRSVSS